MSISPLVQPDQEPLRWDQFASPYERVFEPLTTAFAALVLDRLGGLAGHHVIDVACGPGGAAIEAAARGAIVTAVDASPAMIDRVRARSPTVDARVMDGMALDLGDAAFDLGFSGFGVVLFPEPSTAMAELRRVIRPGGRVAIVTWTEPQRYELAARLQRAIVAVRGAPLPPGPLPAQLRFIEPELLGRLISDAGFQNVEIVTLQAEMTATSARDLAGSLAFAPGMAAMLDAIGPARDAVLDAFAGALEAEQGGGAVRLGAVAHAAIAVRPHNMVEA